MRHKAKSPTAVAQKLLNGAGDKIEELRIHEFADDAAAHDDEAHERLYREFSAELDAAKAELSKTYGKARTGNKDDDAIAVTGVFRFALWKVGKRRLWIAATHEDREVPIMLLMGATSGIV